MWVVRVKSLNTRTMHLFNYLVFKSMLMIVTTVHVLLIPFHVILSTILTDRVVLTLICSD
jgi:hypothetical protein